MDTNKQHIGKKKTFWSLVNGKELNNILIPTIQRDYTYGSGTLETDRVLNNMLDNIKKSLFSDNEPEMTMNFVYGYREEQVNYVPLDGQQRLTTLFLLYYYAALNNDNGDFDSLRKFTYATRETTKNYCIKILENHIDILQDTAKTKSISSAIEDMPWYLPSFNNDPSIRSMQVVLDRIEKKFCDVKDSLWNKLVLTDCPVNFYILDFGLFGLSDDLYMKMNSRGKKLTEYEIFKSMLLKHIEKKLELKDYKRDLALKFDNDWTDLVWETIGRPQTEDKLKNIDNAYILLMKLITRILAYIHNAPEDNIELSKQTIEAYMNDKKYINFINEFMCAHVWAKKEFGSVDIATDHLLRDIKQIYKKKYGFSACLNGDSITNGDLLFLYGCYCGFSQLKDGKCSLERVQLNMRHLRNVIENSDNEIRTDKMLLLINEVHDIMTTNMVKGNNVKVAFNTNIWVEEIEKENNIEAWKRIWSFEEHELLRGSLSNFGYKRILNLSDEIQFTVLKTRLEKFTYIFDDNYKENDRLIRAALLTGDDYTQNYGNVNFRLIGNIPLCWRGMLVKSEMRKNQEVIINVIDQIQLSPQKIENVLHGMIDDYLDSETTDKSDWRYYAVKYSENTYMAYSHADGYGYFYMDRGLENTLGVVVLQSSYFGTSNVAWYLLNLILYNRNVEKYNINLGDHAAQDDEADLTIITDEFNICLGILCEEKGWSLDGLSLEKAKEIGIPCYEKDGEDQTWLICTPETNVDYIEWAEQKIFRPLERIEGFKKIIIS